MPRLDPSVAYGLMNPTYAGKVAEVGGMLGGMAGKNIKARNDKAEAQRMAGMTTEGLLQAQREAASTPAEAIAAGMAQEKFGRETEDRKREERERKQQQAEKLARAKLSALGKRRAALLRAGKPEEAKAVALEMEEVAGGAMVEVGDYMEDVTADSAKRYLNVGGGKIFDAVKGEFVTDPTAEQVDSAGPELEPKDFLSNIRQQQKDSGTYTEESFQRFLSAIPEKGVYAAAKEELIPTDLSKAEAEASAGRVTDASRVLNNIDEIMELAPESAAGAVGQATLSGVPWTDFQALETKVNTLRANTAFDRLQKMRDQSKTGGALGQVSEKELALLQDNLAALNPSSKTFREDLAVIKQAYQRIIDIEMGPDGGSPNYRTGPDGRVFYRDATSGIVYDYETGQPVSKRG